MCFLALIVEMSLWGWASPLKFWSIIVTSIVGLVSSGLAGYILGVVKTQDIILLRMNTVVREKMEDIVVPTPPSTDETINIERIP